MYRRIGRTLLTCAVTALVILTSCQMALPAPKLPMKVGVAAYMLNQEFSVVVCQTAVDALKKAGVGTVYLTDAGANPAQHVADIENLLEKKVDALIIYGAAVGSLDEVLDRAARQGVPVIGIDNFIAGAAVKSVVSFDQTANGVMSGEFIADYLKGKGNIAILYRPGHDTIDIRYRGLKRVLSEYPDIKVVAELPYKGPNYVADVMSTVESLLAAHTKKGSLDMIWGSFNLVIVGASRAVEASGRTDVVVTGVNGSPANGPMIAKGVIAGVIDGDVEALGTVAAKAAIKAYNGDKLPDEIKLPVVTVTKDNLPPPGRFPRMAAPEWLSKMGLGW